MPWIGNENGEWIASSNDAPALALNPALPDSFFNEVNLQRFAYLTYQTGIGEEGGRWAPDPDHYLIPAAVAITSGYVGFKGFDDIKISKGNWEVVATKKLPDEKAVDVIGWIDSSKRFHPDLSRVIAYSTKREGVLASLAPAFGIVLMAVPGLGAMIGEFVMGPAMAAAYPQLTAAVGNIALKSAVNGGDIASAVKGVVSSFAGGQFGDIVGSGVDSDVIGSVAASVTSAALSGGDVKMALLSGAAKGVSGMDWSQDDTGGSAVSLEDIGVTPETFDPGSFDPGYVDPGSVDYGSYDPFADIGFAVDDPVLTSPENAAADVMIVDDTGMISLDGDPMFTPEEVNAYAAVAGQPGADANALEAAKQRISEKASSSGISLSLADITKFAGDALKLATSFATLQAQKRNGTLATAGVLTPSGSRVITNPNGTRTITYPDGRTLTTASAYQGSGSLLPGISNTTLAIGAGSLIALVLITSSRRK